MHLRTAVLCATLLAGGFRTAGASVEHRTEAWPFIASADTTQVRHAIQERAAKVSNQTRANADLRLDGCCVQVDQTAKECGEAQVARRIADEFALDPVRLQREHDAAQASWGELLVASVLALNTRTAIAPRHLVLWHHAGLSWSQLACGLGLELDSTVSAVDLETRVARGRAKPDHRVATIRGENARMRSAGFDPGL
jgi:hypothetical protein